MRGVLSLSLLGCLLILAGLASPVAAEEREAFVFSRLNRTYQEFVTDLAPIEVGPATVQLRTPRHRLDLHEHTARLVHAPDGSGLLATVDLSLSGSGLIEADVQLGSIESRLEDELTLPRQALRLEGRVSVARSDGGYVVRTLTLPETITVQIESRLAKQLFAICRPMALVLVSMDCVALENALTRIVVPLPAAGEGYVLGFEEMTPEEQARFERFLDQ